jgi:hypothetical protein
MRGLLYSGVQRYHFSPYENQVELSRGKTILKINTM